MAAKVKLLQRELKMLKADLAFSKERCAQLEEENRQLRDGNHDADEDMVRARSGARSQQLTRGSEV
jgi:cell division protein FtsB